MDDFPQRFPKTAAMIEGGIPRDLHIGAQIYVSLNRDPIANWAVGVARQPDEFDPAGVALTTSTIMPWFSAGKPLAAIAIAQLMEAGSIALADPVAKYLPPFAVKGKEPITIAHLLMHTGGFRQSRFDSSMTWDQIIAHICQTPLEPRWIPGKTAGYHPETSWYILGEIIRLVDPAHRTYAALVRDEIFRPLGMDDSWLSSNEQFCRERRTSLAALRVNTPLEHRTIDLADTKYCGRCSPGASAAGPAAQLGLFYEMLLNEGKAAGGKTLISPQTVHQFTIRQRIDQFDLTFKHIVDWGYGFIVNSAQYGQETLPYGFGPHATLNTFGHGGRQSSVGMADPEHGLVIALIFNGMPGEIAHRARMHETLGAIYEDLNLQKAR